MHVFIYVYKYYSPKTSGDYHSKLCSKANVDGAIYDKITFSNIKLSKKALLIVVLEFLKVKIRKALRCNIVSLEDLLKLNNVCHLVRKFSNLSLFYLSSVNFFSIHMKRVSAFLYYTASFILVIAIVFCQSNLFWDCANGFVNIFSVHNDFNATNNFIRFLNFTYSFMEVNVDVSYDGNRNLSELMNKSKPGSHGSNNNVILVFLFLTSLFFHLLIKQKPDVRVKVIPLTIFTIESINKFESLYTSHLPSQSVFLSVSQLMYCNSNSYHRLLLLLSGDISLNPGPFHNLQPLDQNEWNIFKHRGLHFLHLNINSLLPKIDELRHIARLINAAVIGISESKLDYFMPTSEIQIDQYDLLCCERNRHERGIACYIRIGLSCNAKSYFPKDVENIFFELL